MKIKRFSYENKAQGWTLEPIELGEFNVLVGLSGSGKSRILQAIDELYWLFPGNGSRWEVEFSLGQQNYRWLYEEEWPFTLGITTLRFPYIAREELQGPDFLFSRELGQVSLNGQRLPQEYQAGDSLLRLFSSDERVKPIEAWRKKIMKFNLDFLTKPQEFKPEDEIENIIIRTNSLEQIQQSNYPIQTKLMLALKCVPEIFEQIRADYSALFPQVRGIGTLESHTLTEISLRNTIPKNILTYPFYLWQPLLNGHVAHANISTGMLKTLLLIGAIYLSPPGSVILIDDFDTHLGVNATKLFDQISYKNRNLQFIIASHHPYMLNSVEMADWKIVTAQGSRITVKNATEFNLSETKYTAFNQVMELL